MPDSSSTAPFTNEAKGVFKFIKENLIVEFPTAHIMPVHYLMAVMQATNSVAFRVLSNIMTGDSLDMLKEWGYGEISRHAEVLSVTPLYDDIFDKCIKECRKNKKIIDSGLFLVALIKGDKVVSKKLNSLGVTIGMVEESLSGEAVSIEDTPPAKETKGGETKKKPQSKPKQQKVSNGVLDKNLKNISAMSERGAVPECYGNDEVIGKMFSALLKKGKNNVLLVGDAGSGKTCTVRHIANMINEGNVPRDFRNKRVMQMDFSELISGATYRGMFEGKFGSIVDEASKDGNIIIVIDDIHSILNPNSKFSEISTEGLLDSLLSNGRIMVIATTTHEGYSHYIASSNYLTRKFERVVLKSKSAEESVDIVTRVIEPYELYHNVTYTPESIAEACRLCERYLPSATLPDAAIDVLDEVGAMKRVTAKDSKELAKLKEELSVAEEQSDIMSKSASASDEEYTACMEKVMSIKSRIAKAEKKESLKGPVKVTTDDVCDIISKRTSIPVGQMTGGEKDRLKRLSSAIKKSVVGQDEAVDKICRVVKRQRVGIANPNKPSSMMLVGKTGCGKSFLAKQLAKEVFGSEKNMVRLDMSEYADKISVNKLTGSAAGYVGYDDGGLLTEAIKKNNHCVLLLDEIEKANEEVFNVFLQVFDEGRLTDNKGVTVDFKNVIILMTSNIGVKEVAEKPNGIGFTKHDGENEDRAIIMKSIKKSFKPEFINRIDDIIFFNTLSEDNLRQIAINEIAKVHERVKSIGYTLSSDLLTGSIVDSILSACADEREYGARPIIREIQRQLEDRVTDYLINHDPKPGHKITMKDLESDQD